jgi:hypothetical protein
VNIFGPVRVNQNELQNAVVANLASAPPTPKPGQFYFDTVALTAMFFNGTAMVPADASKLVGTIPNAALTTNPLARANHTGTQIAATISDLAPTVKAYTLDTFAAPAANVAFNAKNITGLADPVNTQDAATKNYTDNALQSAVAGIDSKPAVACVSTSNIAALTGATTTIDGITAAAGTRVLLTAQTTTSQNGVWVTAAGAWVRPSGDSSPNGELALGAFWFVEQGTSYAATQWRLGSPTSGAITPGTTAVTITQFGAAQTYTANNGVALTGSNFAAQVVALGGILASAAGLYLDTTISARKYSANIGDGSATQYTITHNLGTLDVVAAIRDAAGNNIEPDWQAASTNTVVVTFSAAPATNAYRITVVG